MDSTNPSENLDSTQEQIPTPLSIVIPPDSSNQEPENVVKPATDAQIPPPTFFSYDEDLYMSGNLFGSSESTKNALSYVSSSVSPKKTPAGSMSMAKPNPQKHRASQFISSTLQSGTDYVKNMLTFSKPDNSNACSYSDIESAIGRSFVDSSNNHFSSNALDVLALYIKGQKLLYTEAKTYCEQQLNFLMLPAIFISCVGSIFSFLSDRYVDGPLIVASLNGFNAFLLALISYLKLDAKAQAHKTSAYKFDKLESMCEFNSGKFMFFANEDKEIMSVVEKIEMEVKEIKETNQFILPESIRYEFTFTYSTNVFMLVKKIQSLEMAETHSLKNCVNYMTLLKDQLDIAQKKADQDLINKLTDAIRLEDKRKNQFIENILDCRKRYFDLDEEFNREIKKHIKRSNRSFIMRAICCDWLKS